MNMAELSEVQGRAWEDVDVSFNRSYLRFYMRLPMIYIALTCILRVSLDWGSVYE